MLKPPRRRIWALVYSRNEKWCFITQWILCAQHFFGCSEQQRKNRCARDTPVFKAYRGFEAGSTNFFAFMQKSSIHQVPPNKKRHPASRCLSLFGGREWIRTTEARCNRFTVCPLWPLGNSPIWSWRTESNHQPADYKSAALPIELRQHFDAPRRYLK